MVVGLLLLAIALFMYMEKSSCVSDDSDNVETFVNKNNIGTVGDRFDIGIIQGGGGYPFVY